MRIIRNKVFYRIIMLAVIIAMVMPMTSAFAQSYYAPDSDKTVAAQGEQEQIDQGQISDDEIGEPAAEDNDEDMSGEGDEIIGDNPENADGNDSEAAENNSMSLKKGEVKGPAEEDQTAEEQEPMLQAKEILTPVMAIKADFPGVGEGESLPSDRRFSVNWTVKKTGGTSYNFSRTITKTYEEFTGLTDLETGDYTFTLNMGSTGAVSQWELVGDTTVDVELKDDGKFYLAGTNKPFVAEYTNNKVLEFTIHSTDKSGKALTDAKLAENNYSVSYAFIPVSATSPDPADYFNNVHSQEEYEAALEAYFAAMQEFFRPYRSDVNLTKQDQTLEMVIPADASERNPYVLYIAPIDDFNQASPYVPPYYLMDTLEVYYYGVAMVGDEVDWDMGSNPYQDFYTVTSEGGVNTIGVQIDTDRQNVAPKLDIYTTAPDNLYPLYVNVRLTGGSYGGSTNEIKVKIDEAGKTTVAFPNEVRTGNNNHYNISWRLTEEDYETINDNFPDNNYGNAYVTVNKDGTLTNSDTGNTYVVYIDHPFNNNVEIPMHTTFSGDYDAADYFPVYVKAQISGSGSQTYTAVKKIENLEDANTPIVFADSIKVDSRSKTVRWNFYKDEDCTVAHDKWLNRSVSARFDTGSYQLVYDGSASNVEKDGARITLSYSRLHLPVVTEAKKPSADTFPSYLKLSVRLNEVINNTKIQTITLTEAGEQTAYFDYMVSRGTGINLVGSGVFKDQEATTPNEGWRLEGYVESSQHGSGGYISNDGEFVCTGRDSSSGDYRALPQKVRVVWGGVIPEFKVEVDFKGATWTEVANHDNKNWDVHVDLLQETITNGEVNRQWVGASDRATSSFHPDSYNYVGNPQVISYADTHSYSNKPVYVTPGKYYVYYYVYSYGTAYNHYNVDEISHDFNYSPPKGVPVYVQEDGSVVDENGDPFTVHFEYLPDDGGTGVIPTLKVNTIIPDSIYNADKNLTERFHIMLTGVEDTNTDWVDQNTSIDITKASRGKQDYSGSLSEPHKLYWSIGNGSWIGYGNKKIPVGEYDLSWYTAESTGSHMYTFNDKDADAKWTSMKSVRVTLREDGRFYIGDEEYVLLNELADAIDSLKVKVNFTVPGGVDDAFTAGDRVYVALMLNSNPYDGGSKWFHRVIADNTITVTEEGIKEISLSPVNNQLIYPGDGGDIPYNANDNYPYSNNYYLAVVTYHADGTVNTEWPKLNIDHIAGWDTMGTEEYSGYGYRVYVNTDGTVSDPGSGLNAEEKVFEYGSLKYKWEETPNAKTIKQAENGEIIFKPITNVKQIQDKQHYMIVVHNRFDNKWYALSYDDERGDQMLLEDVSSLEDLESGYIRAETDLASTPYVFTAGKVTQNEGSADFQFKTGLKDENKKTIAIKMGASAKEYLPIFTNSAGTLTAVQTGTESNSGVFSINKNKYSTLAYIDEFFGLKGFTVASRNYGTRMEAWREYGNWDDPDDNTIYSLINPGDGSYLGAKYLNRKPSVETFAGRYYSMYEMPAKYLTDAYWQKLANAYGSDDYSRLTFPDNYSFDFYILSDTQVDEVVEAENKNYKLVKTLGDFNNTFLYNEANNKSLVMVYTDSDGKEYALNPKGLTEVVTTEGAAEYRTLTCGSDNEVIPNNESRNSQGETSFNFVIADKEGDGDQVVATHYGFRKSRANSYSSGEYLTMNYDVWTPGDSGNDTFVLTPTAKIRDEVDWDKPTSYKLSVNRNGKTYWLGVKENDNGKLEMTIVNSEADAITIDIYAPNVERYYTDFMSDEYGTYYKINSLADIGEDDQILIIYNDNGTKRLLSATSPDQGRFEYTDNNGYDRIGNRTEYPALYVSEQDSPFDTDDESLELPENFKYYYNLASEDPVKHVYAYMDSDNEDVIIAQGVAANIIGPEKSISSNSNQEKYEYLTGLGYLTNNKLFLKGDQFSSIYAGKSEVNFFYDKGQFYMRGGKDIYWLGYGTYDKPHYNMDSNGYYSGSEQHESFRTVDKPDRVPVEIYKKGSDAQITINYYDPDNLNGDPARSETKAEGLIGLPQDADKMAHDEDYIFVGWTKDKSKAGYLSKEESANLYDFDDRSRKASVTEKAKADYGLLGNCNPEKTSNIKVLAKDLEETDGVLNLYPVYALRGRTEIVTADENDGTKVVGIGDVKDLEEGSDGTIEARERWLGSINVEVYRDGELWIPKSGSSGTNSGDGNLSGMAADGDGKASDSTATMYFAYHNDDAADVNIKFIANSVTDAMLEEYVRDNQFSAAEPTNMYVIDAVFAEQGGSEDGLKYKYNWVDPVLGGQLDNVRGGSTIKIYVTTKYQVKYYFDAVGDGEYTELTDDAHKDNNYYTTPGTETAVTANQEKADYVVVDKDDEENIDLIRRTPSNTKTFVDDNIRRGEYSFFQYEFDNYNHVFPVAALPEPPGGKQLDSDVWTIKNASMDDTDTATPGGEYEVTGTVYGTGTTVHSYKGAALNDVTRTYHLYISVVSNLTSLKITKTLSPYDQNASSGDSSQHNQGTFVFNVKAELNNETVYEDVVSFTFNGPRSQTKTIKGIPEGAKVTVTEIYSGAEYEVSSDNDSVEVEIVPAGSGDEQKAAEFSNEYDGTLAQGYGVNNAYKFKQGKWEYVK